MQFTSDEVFINLVRVAKEDEKIKKFLLSLTELNSFGRVSLINSFISEMTLKGAPSQLINAIAALRDERISKDIGKYLKDE